MKIKLLTIITTLTLSLTSMYISTDNEEPIHVADLREEVQYTQPVSDVMVYGGVSEYLRRESYDIEVVEEPKYVIDITDKERDELVRLIMCEAGGEDLDGKILVGNVVINRVNSEEFPDDIISVIRQRRGDIYQFSPVSSGKIDRVEPSEECYEALDMVLQGYDISNEALYFESCSNENNWHSRNLEYLFKHGGHRFYK